MSEAKHDGYSADDLTGAITFTIDGTAYVLPPPKFGVFRKFCEANEARMVAEMRARNGAREVMNRVSEILGESANAVPTDEQVAALNDAVIDSTKAREAMVRDSLGRCLTFWAEQAPLLGATGFPAGDDLPPWLGNADIITWATDHWCLFPTKAPGAPALLPETTGPAPTAEAP